MWSVETSCTVIKPANKGSKHQWRRESPQMWSCGTPVLNFKAWFIGLLPHAPHSHCVLPVRVKSIFKRTWERPPAPNETNTSCTIILKGTDSNKLLFCKAISTSHKHKNKIKRGEKCHYQSQLLTIRPRGKWNAILTIHLLHRSCFLGKELK